MIQNKKDLEDFLRDYNFFRYGNGEIVFSETDRYIKLELGGHWITKIFKTNSTQNYYQVVFNSFFKFLCHMATENIPIKPTADEIKFSIGENDSSEFNQNIPPDYKP